MPCTIITGMCLHHILLIVSHENKGFFREKNRVYISHVENYTAGIYIGKNKTDRILQKLNESCFE
jgi:uncharacterized alkaline shock family protein YloU